VVRKAVEARVDKRFEGGARSYFLVLTRKGGVGKTTITALPGMALSDIRETASSPSTRTPTVESLSERVNKQTRPLCDVRRINHQSASTNFTTMVSRDETRLDIPAPDTDPLLSEAFRRELQRGCRPGGAVLFDRAHGLVSGTASCIW
jgi:hypothetical protein